VSLAERPRLRLVVLSALFLAQGVPWGFFMITVPVVLAAHGASTAELASVATMSYWPYVFKWVGGPFIDAFAIPRFGRRRPWIVFAQVMMAASLASLLLVDDLLASLNVVLVVILVHTAFNALQNVATDALAIDLLDPSERGRANGFMFGFKYAGGMVGGAVLTHVVTLYGMHTAIAIQVVLLLAIGILPLLVRERSGPPAGRPAARELWPALARVYRLRSPWLAGVAMLGASISTGLLGVVAYRLFVGEHLWTEDDWSDLVGGWGLAAGFAGSLLAGVIADKISYRILIVATSFALGTTWIAFGLAQAWTMRPVVYALCVLEPLAQSTLVVTLWSLCMSVTIKRTAATQFAVYTSLWSLSTIIGTRVLAPALADFSYANIYVVAGVIQLAAMVVVPFVDPRQVPRALPDA
jgi:MFS transporter, PAT family, beta-lactamase induction signal transducer AmpG